MSAVKEWISEKVVKEGEEKERGTGGGVVVPGADRKNALLLYSCEHRSHTLSYITVLTCCNNLQESTHSHTHTHAERGRTNTPGRQAGQLWAGSMETPIDFYRHFSWLKKVSAAAPSNS